MDLLVNLVVMALMGNQAHLVKLDYLEMMVLMDKLVCLDHKEVVVFKVCLVLKDLQDHQ